MTRHMEAQLPLNMEVWQVMPLWCDVAVLKEEHLCGTPCCFAGYIAVSPEFHADGGYVSGPGSPEFNDACDEHAIREWLDCSIEHAEAVCSVKNINIAYPNIKTKSIKFADVIAALVSLRDYGRLPGE